MTAVCERLARGGPQRVVLTSVHVSGLLASYVVPFTALRLSGSCALTVPMFIGYSSLQFRFLFNVFAVLPTSSCAHCYLLRHRRTSSRTFFYYLLDFSGWCRNFLHSPLHCAAFPLSSLCCTVSCPIICELSPLCCVSTLVVVLLHHPLLFKIGPFNSY